MQYENSSNRIFRGKIYVVYCAELTSMGKALWSLSRIMVRVPIKRFLDAIIQTILGKKAQFDRVANIVAIICFYILNRNGYKITLSQRLLRCLENMLLEKLQSPIWSRCDTHNIRRLRQKTHAWYRGQKSLLKNI